MMMNEAFSAYLGFTQGFTEVFTENEELWHRFESHSDECQGRKSAGKNYES